METREVLVERLFNQFPQRFLEETAAPHECEECYEIRRHLDGQPWPVVSPEFLRANDGVLPLLSEAAYVAYLPAWLREAINCPAGDLASMVLINLTSGPAKLFTEQQRKLIADAARYLIAESGWGENDPVGKEQLESINNLWAL